MELYRDFYKTYYNAYNVTTWQGIKKTNENYYIVGTMNDVGVLNIGPINYNQNNNYYCHSDPFSACFFLCFHILYLYYSKKAKINKGVTGYLLFDLKLI